MLVVKPDTVTPVVEVCNLSIPECLKETPLLTNSKLMFPPALTTNLSLAGKP